MRKSNKVRQGNRSIFIKREVRKIYLATKDIPDPDECAKVVIDSLRKTIPAVKKWIKYSGSSCASSRVTPLADKSSDLLWVEFFYFCDRIIAPHRLCFLVEFFELLSTKQKRNQNNAC